MTKILQNLESSKGRTLQVRKRWWWPWWWPDLCQHFNFRQSQFARCSPTRTCCNLIYTYVHICFRFEPVTVTKSQPQKHPEKIGAACTEVAIFGRVFAPSLGLGSQGSHPSDFHRRNVSWCWCRSQFLTYDWCVFGGPCQKKWGLSIFVSMFFGSSKKSYR